MKVHLAVFARYAETEPDSGTLNLTGGGIDVFGVDSLPVEFPVYIALRLLFDEDEAGKERTVTLVLKGVSRITRIPQVRSREFPTRRAAGEGGAERCDGVAVAAHAVAVAGHGEDAGVVE